MSISRSFQLACLLLVLVGARCCQAEVNPAGQVAVEPPRGAGQLWLVSTRYAPYCGPNDDQASLLEYWRCDAESQWQSSTLGELLGTDDPSVMTLVYVHENRVTRDESFYRSPGLLAGIAEFAPPGKPFRLIVISWPSDRIGRRPRPDVQAKAQRSESHGYYLAWLLDQIHPDVPISLFGFSYGPRMITTALHYLGGGSVHGQSFSARVHPDRRPVRAVLMAAAVDAHWLSPGQHHGQALTQVEQMLLVVNPCDEALRWYPRLYGKRGPHALGYVGSSCGLGEHGHKVVEWNVSGEVGGTHSWTAYEGSPSMLAKIAPYLFGD